MIIDFQASALALIPSDAVADESPALSVLRLANDADPLQPVLAGVDRIELHFPAFTDGRAFSQAWLLRRRRGFRGDIRATGEVLVDQLQQMARCGFSSAVLAPGQDMKVGRRQLVRYQGFYQGDVATVRPRFRHAGERA